MALCWVCAPAEPKIDAGFLPGVCQATSEAFSIPASCCALWNACLTLPMVSMSPALCAVGPVMTRPSKNFEALLVIVACLLF